MLTNPINTADLNVRIGTALYLKKEYITHPFLSGNKYRKLKYNLVKARESGFDTLLSFGGAFSNHIDALAKAGSQFGFKTIGVIRGEELKNQIHNNPTLKKAVNNGMHLHFVSRAWYRVKDQQEALNTLKAEFGSFYTIPEGGTNALAIKGCEEILTDDDAAFDIICCSVGTGGTLAGIINKSRPDQKVYGFMAVDDSSREADITSWTNKKNFEIISDYNFGGYAKINRDLISFINRFHEEHGIPLDPVYTGKLLYGVQDMIENRQFEPRKKILVIHTGGLQGIAGMNARLKKKGLPLIKEL